MNSARLLPIYWPRRAPVFDLKAQLCSQIYEKLALQDAGLLTTKDRTFAEYAAWSGVHGVAVLLTNGPFKNLPPEAQGALVERVLDMIGIGLTGGAE